MDFKCAQGVFVEGGDEHDRPIGADQLQYFESIQLRHLNVEENKIGIQFGHGFDSFESIRALSDNLDFRMTCKELQQHLAREFLIVDNDGFDFGLSAAHVRSPFCCAGKRRLTEKRLPSAPYVTFALSP